MIELHPHFELLAKLDKRAVQRGPDQELFQQSAAVIRELKSEIKVLRDKYSRLQYPGGSGL